MLTCILDHNLGLYHRCSRLETHVQNAALAEGEGGRLRCAWRFIIHSTAAWSPAIRARVHDAILGNEMVSARAGFL